MFTEPFLYTQNKYHLSLQFTGTTNTYNYWPEGVTYTTFWLWNGSDTTSTLYVYNIQEPLKPIVFQNHLYLHVVSAINAYKSPKLLISTIFRIVGLSGSIQSTKAYKCPEVLIHFEIHPFLILCMI